MQSIYLLEGHTEPAYEYTVPCSFYCFEDISWQIIYRLSAVKTCGLLMLITRLLSTQSLEAHQQERNYMLAKKLLLDFHKTSIIIHPSREDDVSTFVKQTIQAAESIAANPQYPFPVIYIYARRLVNAIKVSESAPEEVVTGMLENSWNAFTFHLLQRRLDILTEEELN